MKAKRRNNRYHHDSLPAALIEVTKDLIAERGLEAFTLREAMRPEVERLRRTTAGAFALRLYSEERARTGNGVGTFRTPAAAEKHEREIQFFKRRR